MLPSTNDIRASARNRFRLSRLVEGGAFPLTVLAALILLALTLYLFIGPSNAHPADDPNAAWYRSLHTDSGTSCCSLADCKETDYRITRSGEIEAQTEAGDWVAVPANKILKRTENPTGYAVLCWTPALGVLCFVMAPRV